MTNWIATGTKIDAVAANNDEMAIGALIAMKQAGVDPEKVCVGGVDATADALARMHAGDLDVTVFQDAKGQGRGAVEAAVKLANKEKQDQMRPDPLRARHQGQRRRLLKASNNE